MNITALRTKLATALLLLCKDALVERVDAREALLEVVGALAAAGAPEYPLSELRKWARKQTTVKRWEEA